MNWTLKRTDHNVLEVRCIYEKEQQVFNFLLQSDVHFDNPKCDRKLYFKHLAEAKARNAGIFCFGDFFDLMQSRHDRRRTKSSIRPEHNTDTYQDTVIQDSAYHLKEYAGNFIAFSDGNHETAVVKNIEVNPLANLALRLNMEHGGNMHHLPYQGFIRFVFQHKAGGGIRKVNLAYHHGNWGGVVTKGTLSVIRYASIFPDADIIISGHTHDQWLVKHEQYKLDRSAKIYQKTQYHVKSGTYKQEFQKGSGWAVEKITMPKSLGAWFLKLELSSNDKIPKISLEMA